LANAEILPLDVEAYAGAIRDFVRKLEDIPGIREQVDLAGLVGRTRALRAAGRRLNERIDAALAKDQPGEGDRDRINRALLDFEGNWANPAGIPGRPWFKHLLYAPRYTYAAMTLPGITEAAEAGDWSRAREQAGLVAAAIAKNTALLEAAGREVESFAAPADSLQGRLEAIRAGFDGRMAVYAKNLATGGTTALDADAAYETFSVIKGPLMAAVHERAKEGTPSLYNRAT